MASNGSSSSDGVDKPTVVEKQTPVDVLLTLTRDDVMKMKFASEEDAYLLYNTYARALGFSIRKDRLDKATGGGGEVVARLFVCSCAGVRQKIYVEMKDRVRGHREETRTNCRARLKIKHDPISECFNVVLFNMDHNHPLSPVYTSHYLRSHRHIDNGHLDQAITLRDSGIPTTKIMDVFLREAGGYQNVGFMRRDLYNALGRIRTDEISEGDVNVTLAYLEGRCVSDPLFVFKHTVDEENRLDKLFFCDGRSRREYAVFGDVLIFDATYKTNAYGFPLVVLAGVNNHRKTCIFGLALVKNETTESYVWLLETLTETMNGKKPTSVVTDGDRSMAAAIELVFPRVGHRLCKWHLNRNAVTNVKVDGFGAIFKKLMGLPVSVDLFEEEWWKMVQEHDLGEDRWIIEAYEKRAMWAEAYLRGSFFGFVKATQRCEGMNSYFKRFLNSKVKFIEFVKGCLDGMVTIRDNASKEEYLTNQTSPVTTTALDDYEIDASKKFTRALFYKVRKELAGQGDLHHTEVSQSYGSRTYVIVSHKYPRLIRRVCITFDGSRVTLECSCLLFESHGIPCRHIFFVMKVEGAREIPNCCIKFRWTPGSSVNLRDKCLAEFPHTEIETARMGFLNAKWKEMRFHAARSERGYNDSLEAITNVVARTSHFDNEDGSTYGVPIPRPARRPIVEDPVDPRAKGPAVKNSRKCSRCKLPGHQKNNCPTLHLRDEPDDEEVLYQFDGPETTNPHNFPYV